MRIVNEDLLREMRRTLRCEWCGRAQRRPLQVHHLFCRGMGSGGRLDIPENLVALCATVGTTEGCHDKAQRGEIPREDVLALVAAREDCSPVDIRDMIDLYHRLPREAPMQKCPVEGCTRQIAERLFMCPRHWFKVPCQLRPGIHRAYQDYLDDRIDLEELRDIQRPVVELVQRGGAA